MLFYFNEDKLTYMANLLILSKLLKKFNVALYLLTSKEIHLEELT